jgi:hypothetical protein
MAEAQSRHHDPPGADVVEDPAGSVRRPGVMSSPDRAERRDQGRRRDRRVERGLVVGVDRLASVGRPPLEHAADRGASNDP